MTIRRYGRLFIRCCCACSIPPSLFISSPPLLLSRPSLLPVKGNKLPACCCPASSSSCPIRGSCCTALLPPPTCCQRLAAQHEGEATRIKVIFMERKASGAGTCQALLSCLPFQRVKSRETYLQTGFCMFDGGFMQKSARCRVERGANGRS